jgi:hypothetical protein
MMALRTCPIGLRAANDYVAKLHRHHGPTRGHKFSIAVEDEHGVMHGVAIAGRPVARRFDNGRRLEVLRVCTDGTPNACSMLYGATARAAVAMGYARHDVFTYILDDELGVTLKASGWVHVADTGGGSWSRDERPRTDKHPTVRKQRWHAAMPPVEEVAA